LGSDRLRRTRQPRRANMRNRSKASCATISRRRDHLRAEGTAPASRCTALPARCRPSARTLRYRPPAPGAISWPAPAAALRDVRRQPAGTEHDPNLVLGPVPSQGAGQRRV
jgi:hypothetical protein